MRRRRSQRDPDDTLAHSIAAVSGLRVASKALADLTRKNNLSGTIRSEAQDLAKLLRTSLGEEALVPGSRTARTAAARRRRSRRKPRPPRPPHAKLRQRRPVRRASITSSPGRRRAGPLPATPWS